MTSTTNDFQAGALLMFTGPFIGTPEHEQLSATVDAALAAEAEGFDELWVGEHHYFEAANPSAVSFAGYLLGRTSRVRVGTAAALLPLHNPVHLAECTSVLDHLSDGRFSLGVGRGSATAVVEVMSSIDHHKNGMSDALDILMQSFGGKVAADTARYRFREVAPQPLPFTKPHPPVLLASGSAATVELAARHGLPCMMFLDPSQNAEAVAGRVRHHTAVAADHGHPGTNQHALMVYAQVADTDDEAARIIRGPLRETIRVVDTQYIWLYEAPPLSGNDGYFEDIVAHHAVGTPETCIERLVDIVRRSGVSRLILSVEASGTPAGLLENVQRIGREVLPEVRRRLANGVSASEAEGSAAYAGR